jgi:hypothetical protein
VVSPIDTPEMTRATMRPGKLGKAMNSSALSTLTASAGTSTRRRPTQSDTCPPRNRLAITPMAYTAYTTVIISVEKWSRCW